MRRVKQAQKLGLVIKTTYRTTPGHEFLGPYPMHAHMYAPAPRHAYLRGGRGPVHARVARRVRSRRGARLNGAATVL